ncbi:FAD/NAD(P)-binding protein [bacterium]
MDSNFYKPEIMKIVDIVPEVEGIKTFVIDNSENKIIHKPGQFALITPMFGHGEIVISISSSPLKKDLLEFSIKKVGLVTEVMHTMEIGSEIAVRGPYGRPFPMEDLENKNLIFIAGGIGLVPLRSVINTVFYERDKYKKVVILYGARSPQDIVFRNELFNVWPDNTDTIVASTVDIGDDSWNGKVGYVPVLMDEIEFPVNDTKILTCGPQVMIKSVLTKLKTMGYSPADIITTLELKMKCGVGKCGRCNIGSNYVCMDGPVFTLEELEKLPGEY